MNRDPTAKRLAALGAKQLAASLLELAGRNEDAARLVERMAASPDENIRRFTAGLRSLRRRTRFVPYRESGSHAEELRALLRDLEDGRPDPRTGAELVAAFYRADAAIFEACDDSDGLVGDVLRLDARDLFVRYASACDDKAWLTGLVFDLMSEDDYGVRDAVIGAAAQYLSEAALRDLAGRLWKAAESAAGTRQHADHDWSRHHWFLLVEVVARQLNDPTLFERARTAWSPELGTAACTDIAAAWLAAGDATTALAWLERIAPEDPFLSDERDDLLRVIHEQLGHRDALERLVWRRFHAHRSGATLHDLLTVIGPEQRDSVVFEAAEAVRNGAAFDPDNAAFLVECDRTGEAADYVVERRAQLDGNYWAGLVPLAETFEAADRPLAATVIYRALLDTILARGQARAYRHGARYLDQLGRLAQGMPDWAGVAPHAAYVADLQARHRRKASFWARCGGLPRAP